MTILAQLPISQEQIKLRWQEPYVSAALNNKNFRTMPRGIYRGFQVIPGPFTTSFFNVTVTTGGPTGTPGYEGGNYDPASRSGWSVAVHESTDGYNATVIMQQGVNSDYTFDLAAYANSTIYIVLDVQYIMGFPTQGQIKIVNAIEIDANPSMLVLARIDVPAVTPVTIPNIITDDALYPVVLPFANEYKYGFMSAIQAEELKILTANTSSPAFEVEYLVSAGGAQVIAIPGGHIYTVAAQDLFIFKNGIKMTRGRDYTEINRGDGFGEQINFLVNLHIDDRILFRGQAYAVSLNNSLAVMDEGSTVSTNVTRLNFVGNGVLVTPESAGRVRVTIPTIGTSGASSSKAKLNSTGATIPQATVVHLLSDGSITICDPRNSTHYPFGITSGATPDGEYGTVIVAGVAVNALVGIGSIATGQRTFITDDGLGKLTIVPPNPVTSNVFQFGIADCADGTASGSPADVVIQIQQLI